jgi:hypothetical protein
MTARAGPSVNPAGGGEQGVSLGGAEPLLPPAPSESPIPPAAPARPAALVEIIPPAPVLMRVEPPPPEPLLAVVKGAGSCTVAPALPITFPVVVEGLPLHALNHNRAASP